MADAWSNTKQYIQGDQVASGGHTYEWGSADPSRGVAPPGGSWVRMDAPAEAGGGGVPDSRMSLYNSTPLSTAVELPLPNLAVDVSAGTDITLDADATTIHLADGHTYLIQASATIAGDTQSTTHLIIGLSMSGAVGFDGGSGVGVMPAAGIGGALQAGGSWWVRSGSGTSFQVLVSPLGAAAAVNINAGIDVVRVV